MSLKEITETLNESPLKQSPLQEKKRRTVARLMESIEEEASKFISSKMEATTPASHTKKKTSTSKYFTFCFKPTVQKSQENPQPEPLEVVKKLQLPEKEDEVKLDPPTHTVNICENFEHTKQRLDNNLYETVSYKKRNITVMRPMARAARISRVMAEKEKLQKIINIAKEYGRKYYLLIKHILINGTEADPERNEKMDQLKAFIEKGEISKIEDWMSLHSDTI